MYYSVTFVDSSGEKRNTWEDWKLVPTSPPMIDPPEVYTNIVEIPGRALGPLDLSEVPFGHPSYKNSEGSWEFILDDGGFSRTELYSILKKFLHGRYMKIMLEEDPFHYYQGRMSIGMPQTGNSNSVFTLDYVIAPVRYHLDGTIDSL